MWRFLKKLKLELPYDPAILLLGIYPEKFMVMEEGYIRRMGLTYTHYYI